MQLKRLKIGISLGKQDEDIASWYKMLRDNGLSISEWTIYLILAYIRQDEEFDIGAIADPSTQNEPFSPLENIYGSGNTQLENRAAKNFSIGLSIKNQKAVETLLRVHEQGWTYTKFIKMLIRRYIRKGSVAEPPVLKVSNILVDISANTADRTYTTQQEQNRKHRRDKKKRNRENQKEDSSDASIPAADSPIIPTTQKEDPPNEESPSERNTYSNQEKIDILPDKQDVSEFVLDEEADPKEPETTEDSDLSRTKNPILAMIW